MDQKDSSRLSLNEVRSWARICQTGNPQEVNEALTQAYIKAKPFIVYVSLKAAKPGMDKEAMISAGSEGFVAAIMAFDWKSGNGKLGFVGSYIRNYVLKECSLYASPLTAPYSSYSRDNRIKALKNALEIEGKDPTPEAIAEASTNPKFSRAGYGRKRKDGSDRQPVPITIAQVEEWLIRSERVYSDIEGVELHGEDTEKYSELVELARELAYKHCNFPHLVMENFESGKIPAKDLQKEGVKRAQLRKEINKLIELLRGQLSEEDF